MPALSEGQVSVRGLIMGPGTGYVVAEFAPEEIQARGETTARAWAHGSWGGAEFAAERVVSMTITVNARTAADWDELHHDLQAAFAPIGTDPDTELRWRIGGSEYLMFGRPRSANAATKLVHQGISTVACGFVALDPLKYSGDEQTVDDIGPPAFSGGLALPTTVPFAIGAAPVNGQAATIHVGTAPTGMAWRITGPAQRPRVLLTGPDGTRAEWSYLADVPVGSWLDVDTAARTVFEAGRTSRRAQVTGDWPLLNPGESLLRLRGWRLGEAASLTARWRHAWW
ncbi:MAG: hypothetical protein ACRD0P_16545 [Stackebrandtia sp.]